ncbi:heavy metal translocating P-type ATPase [Shewanella surugensis]|uniref:Copper-exporting P-type ATPase n=1 Tax=Shewanella surugensis TaxID=212020 RepID=A0ABT0LD78_9GAMM|nr:heavy metal translocating P-type ATPase [Shewanella surugensis]MCL1125615.1 heavy metal translocating P-type ATPase [Shewanella surugensis]
MSTIILSVPDMSCTSCIAKIENAFQAQAGMSVRVNLADKQVIINEEIDIEKAKFIIQSVGYASEQVLDAKLAAKEKGALEEKQYHKQMWQAFIGLGVGIPLMLWGLFGGEMQISNVTQQLTWGVVGVLTLVLMVTTGAHFYQGMWRALKAKSANMDSLIALGTGAAWFYSMLVVLVPQWFPLDTRHVYFEASVMILGLINLGHALELRARGKTSAAVQSLLGLQASTAIRITDKGDEEVEIGALAIGDRVRLKPGGRVALDGEVLEGQSLLNESMLTGEPVPVSKGVGDGVNAGTVNGNGSLIYRITSGVEDTRLAKIIELVQQAQTSKMPIGRLTDQISAYFVPVVIVIALFSAGIWYFAGPAPQLSHALVVLTSVLIIACPCALGLATPMSIMVSVGRAAKMGVLIRNGEALQTASKVSCVVLDKTGTLTQGKPMVTDFTLIGSGEDESTLLRHIASLEQASEHPLASAIIDKAKAAELTLVEPEVFTNHQGMGIVGAITLASEGSAEGTPNEYAIGNRALMDKLHIEGVAAQDSLTSTWAETAKTPIYVSKSGSLVALIAISDPLHTGVIEAVSALKADGMRVVLLSGDNEKTVQAVAKQVGIDEVVAQVLPEEKQQHIIRLQAEGEVVAMVGDGINDAPALVSADVGIAIGSGTEIAIESADLTLLSHQLTSLASTFKLAKAGMRNIKQNLFGAFIYNILGIPLAAGVLFPLTGMLLNPVIAGGAMALSSLTVVTNANRLRNQKLD